ncbi:MAG TPA: NERD nuclease [Campylobacterales bacterium]|nr:NERD nuclease [Campylobacterales bacterium]
MYILLFAVVVTFFKSSFFKGKVGEFLVTTHNKIRLDSSLYTQISDVTLRLNDGSTTQIDHIILFRFGIFVIETKNMKGWIFGSEHQKRWVQSIYGTKNSFQNPLLQNHRHIKALEEVLGLDRGLYSIVTFVGESSFKTAMPVNVFNGGKYIEYLKSFRSEIFSTVELQRIKDTLASKSLRKSRATNREHIASLKKASVASSNLYKSDSKIVCKRCSSVMVERRNRVSDKVFLGCSSYPKCRHTESL